MDMPWWLPTGSHTKPADLLEPGGGCSELLAEAHGVFGPAPLCCIGARALTLTLAWGGGWGGLSTPIFLPQNLSANSISNGISLLLPCMVFTVLKTVL